MSSVTYCQISTVLGKTGEMQCPGSELNLNVGFLRSEIKTSVNSSRLQDFGGGGGGGGEDLAFEKIIRSHCNYIMLPLM